MKKFFVLSLKAALILVLGSVFLPACNREKPAADALDKDTSYAFGMLLASQMGQMGLFDIHFDYEAFKEGFKAFNEAMETRLTPDQAMEKINTAFMRLQSENDERMWLEGQKNIEEGETYLAENRMRSGVTTTPSGLQYEVIAEGTGEKPGPYDDVLVHYEGTFLDGTVFDSSYARGSPIDFNLAEVIPGWTEGVQLMSEGSTYRFVIPSDLAYGPGGSRSIPPNAVLIFRLELISVLQ
jgi:FKBP-type peptidyl-prolyl cis-trans isomerase